MTITRTDGTSFTIDLPLEYIVKSGSYNASTKNIELVLDNDEKIEIPVGALVNEYYGDGTTVTLYIDSADGNKPKFKISDTYKSKIDANVTARHTHSNASVLDNTTASFTTSLKSTYDGYATSIAANATAITEAVSDMEDEIERLEGLISGSGTVVYVDGSPVASLNIDEISVANAYFAEEAVKAKDYAATGSIARKFKNLEARIAALEA